ncbi:MAG: ATP-binding protein [Eubacteriales bacterium]
MKYMQNLNLEINSLVVFRNLLKNDVVKNLMKLLSTEEKTTLDKVESYSEFTSSLFSKTTNLSRYFLDLVLEDENIYVKKYAAGSNIEDVLKDSLVEELKIIEKISKIRSKDIRKNIDYKGFLPSWENKDYDFYNKYIDRMNNISSYGYGIYSKHHTFRAVDGRIIPVKNPDNITLEDLKGYERERKLVLDNTTALINKKPAANVLLYGDAGTGKSSTVKAIVNEYKNFGLRLVEISKKQIKNVPMIMDILGKNPLKFILFIDDLSFTKNDDEFGELKAILEGSIYSKPSNISIYATSNRRHMVKETFSDREGDDLHISETIEEISSLSDRFGLMVSFYRPDKEDFLNIVRELAFQHNVSLPREKLEEEAEKFAVRRSGRSPRIAKQFVEYLQTKK